MPRTKPIYVLRNDLRDELTATMAKALGAQGKAMTDDILTKIEEKVVAKYPYTIEEIKGFMPKVILTVDEIVAAATAIGLGIDEPIVIQGDDDTMTGKRRGDIIVTSKVGDKERTSVIRTTDGSNMHDQGAVTIFRPELTYTRKSETTNDLVDDILKGI